MFGKFSYLYSTLILALPFILIEWLFFYHILKREIVSIFLTVVSAVVIVSFSEPFGLYLQAWTYGSTTTLPALPTGVKLESYLYVILCTISVSSMVIIYTAYEDMKIKYLLLQGFKDLFSCKYALWKK